jgi:hypothetical protein
MAKATNKKNDAAEAAQDIRPTAGQPFKLGKKEFKYVIPQFIVPGIGKRTSLEACTDDTQYEELGGKTINEYLVENGSGAVAEV